MNALFCWNQQFLDWLKYQMQKVELEIHLSGSPSDGFGFIQNQRKFWLVWEVNCQRGWVSSCPVEKTFLTSSEFGRIGCKGYAASRWWFWQGLFDRYGSVEGMISWSKTHQCLLVCYRDMQAWLVVLWRHLLFNQQDMQHVERGTKSLQLLPCQPC